MTESDVTAMLKGHTRQVRKSLHQAKQAIKALERFPRQSARWEILAIANAFKVDAVVPDYGMRNIQGAVFKCRQRHLVSDELLVAAGFRAVGK